MELFPAQPDLTLQISPPNSSSSTDEALDLGFWARALNRSNNATATGLTTTTKSKSNNNSSNSIIDLSLANPSTLVSTSTPSSSGFNHSNRNTLLQDLGSMRPIRGIPVYQSSPHHQYPFTTQQYYHHHHQQHHSINQLFDQTSSGAGFMNSMSTSRSISPRILSRFPGKRSMRAPRMRWTTTLHARFVHAVELLGGHERATPKSVLELMDVKDLTLAHVKSHLQMYRTVKTTDRPPTSSGQNEPIEISDDNLLDIRGPEPMIQNAKPSEQSGNNYYGLWSNSSSRGSWFHDKPFDSTHGTTPPTFEKEVRSNKGVDMNSSSCISEPSTKKPNLEFTLGRSPH